MSPAPSISFQCFGQQFSVRLVWLSALAFTVVYVAVGLAPDNVPTFDAVLWYVRVALLTAGAVVSVLLHERAHGVIARRLGYSFGTVRLYPIGALNQDFTHPASPRTEALIAAAGPILSTAVGSTILVVGLLLPDGSGAVRDTVLLLALGNLGFAACNLLPGLPLDGGRLLRALIWYLHDDYAAGTRFAVGYGQLIGALGLFSGLLLLAGQSRWSTLGALVVIMSWGITRAGRDEVMRSFLTEKGAALSAREMVIGLNPHVRADQALDEILELLLAEMHSGPALVTREAETVGVLGLEQMRRFPRAEWHGRTAAEAMIPLETLPRVDGNVSVRELLEELSASDAQLLVVTDRGQDDVIGVLDRRIAIQRLFGRSKAQSRDWTRRPPL